MLNYIKSEFYRIFHGKEFYLFTGVLALLTVLMNVILCLLDATVSHFPYGSIRYSLNILSSSMELLFYAGMALTSFIFSEEYKNGTLKNTISFGITRRQFFTGKCVVCSAASLLSLVIIMPFYYGSAYLLLDGAGEITVADRLRGVLANLPMAFASVILTVALMCIIKKEMTMVMWWLFLMVFLPIITLFLGFQVEWLNRVAEWMPRNYLNLEVVINMSQMQYKALWDTPEGMAKCLIAGFTGIVVFYLIGWIGFRKKEIA